MGRQRYHQPIQEDSDSLRRKVLARLARRSEKNEFFLVYIEFYIPVGNLMEAEWLPWRLSGKEYACNARDSGDPGSIPGSGRSPRGNGNPLQYSCLENPTDRGGWCTTVQRITKSLTWVSAHTHTHTHTHTHGKSKEKGPEDSWIDRLILKGSSRTEIPILGSAVAGEWLKLWQESNFQGKSEWKSLSHIRLIATPWAVQSMEFSRPEYWSG